MGFTKAFILTLSIGSTVFAAQSATAQDGTVTPQYTEIVRAFNKMIVERHLATEDGTALTFGKGGLSVNGRFIVSFEAKFATGDTTHGVEVLWAENDLVYLDQVVDGVTTRRYVASIEGPLKVLRIRPLAVQPSDFIARDCIRRDDDNGTTCYVKVRYQGDVIVSVFREIHTSFETP